MNKEQFYLLLLAEECSEISHLCSKSIRFGIENIKPDKEQSNAERLKEEIADLAAIIEIMKEKDILEYIPDRSMIKAKKEKVEKYLNISRQLGKVNF